MSHPKIDNVVTRHAYVCSTCGKVRIGLVNRIVNAKPDFPKDAPAVDLLICGECAREIKAEPVDDSDDYHADYIGRLAGDPR